MHRRVSGVWACALVFLFSFAVQAETGTVPRRTAQPGYDVSREITVNGTVSSLLAKPSPGMMWGAHLLLRTSAGNVDASLGRFALMGKGALSVQAGQQVAVTGLMVTIRGQAVLLARIVRAGGQAYLLRSTHGTPLSPTARRLALLKAAQNGGQL